MLFAWAIASLLRTADLEIGSQTLRVEIAETEKEREKGLMGRAKLADGEGMLFVFQTSETLSFWMKGTLIPLSIGFFDREKRLINTAEMPPPSQASQTLPVYQSASPAQYALEAPQNWFKKNKITPGMKFTLHDQAR
jgi:uncharacterized membrane protein (UPF0127 family)